MDDCCASPFINCRAEKDLWVWQMIFMVDCTLWSMNIVILNSTNLLHLTVSRWATCPFYTLQGWQDLWVWQMIFMTWSAIPILAVIFSLYLVSFFFYLISYSFFNCTPHTQITIKHLKHGLFVLYGQYSTQGEVSRHNKALAFASCCIGLSTSPLVLYCPYSTPNHALT